MSLSEIEEYLSPKSRKDQKKVQTSSSTQMQTIVQLLGGMQMYTIIKSLGGCSQIIGGIYPPGFWHPCLARLEKQSTVPPKYF